MLGLLKEGKKSDQYEIEKRLNLREAWQLVGEDPTSANIRTHALAKNGAQLASTTLFSLMRLWEKSSKMPMSSEDKMKLAAPFLEASVTMRESSQYYTNENQLSANCVVKKVLQGLPQDYEYGDTGRTVSEQISIFEDTQKLIFREGKEFLRHFEKANQSQLSIYLQRVDAYGDAEARKWLVNQPK